MSLIFTSFPQANSGLNTHPQLAIMGVRMPAGRFITLETLPWKEMLVDRVIKKQKRMQFHF